MSILSAALFLSVGLAVATIALTRRLKAARRRLDAEIATHKLTEQALQESTEKFNQLADNITDAIWMRSPDMRRVLYISPAFERIWGRLRDAHLSQPEKWAEALHPSDRERVLTAFQALTREARSIDLEYRIMRPDGQIRWVHARGFQVRDQAGQLVRLTGIVSDITERKTSEEAMRVSEQAQRRLAEYLEIERTRLAEAQALAKIGSWEFDFPTNSLTWSDENYRIFGLDRETTAVSREVFLKRVHPDDRPAVARAYVESISNRKPYSTEHRIQMEDGTTRIVQEHCVTYYDKEGNPTRSVGTTQDVTERKRLEGQLFRSQKMETVGKLAGGVAHEFNTILTVIVGQSELLLNDLPPEDLRLNNVIEIRNAANRATALTRQLLAYGRKQILQVETLNLNQTILNLEPPFRHLLGHRIEMHLALAEKPLLARADAGQIEQVLMNMVLNARDAMPNGGRLILASASVTIDQALNDSDPELKPGDYAMISVADSGIGMSEETKTRVFEPFFSTRNLNEAMGLGLATSYGIIKQSGGHITVESQIDRGSIFRIYLPTTEQPPPAPPQLASAPPVSTIKQTILFVEDEPALRELVAQVLSRLHYNVLTAGNGRDAIKLIGETGIDSINLIFTDMMMPQMNGKELADYILARHPKTKFLFTSGYTENLDPNVAFLPKPFSPTALSAKLREILDQ
jgi:two-component system cell cycle sensor histidine kinase/response regulator CckA